MGKINSQYVLFNVENRIGIITLNRPPNLNALNLEMVLDIYETLRSWRDDEEILFVILTSSSERAFSAGGDIRSIYEQRNRDDLLEFAKSIFGTQYQKAQLIYRYPKPIIVNMNGVIMGGGVGLAAGATFRIVTETTKWAMPELNIGFFPDAGATYTFNQMPGEMGTYLALTSQVIGAADLLYVQAADYYLPSHKWKELFTHLKTYPWHGSKLNKQIRTEIERFTTTPNKPAHLSELKEKINHHFANEHIEDILLSLNETANKGDKWSQKTKDTLLKKSPTSLKVVLTQLRKGKRMSLEECIRMETNLALRFMEKGDFFEGVRAMIIDKDRSPKWNPNVLSDVTEEHVRYFFN